MTLLAYSACFSVNVPLQRGCDDRTFCSVFSTVFNLARERFKPDVFVVQVAEINLGPSSVQFNNFSLIYSSISGVSFVCAMLAFYSFYQ